MSWTVGDYSNKDIVANGQTPVAIPVTIKAGVQYVAGQALARKTSDGLYEAHDNDGSGGLEVCSGYLAKNVDTTTANGGQASAEMYVSKGMLVLSQLVHKDADAKAAAIVDLKAREIPGRDILILP